MGNMLEVVPDSRSSEDSWTLAITNAVLGGTSDLQAIPSCPAGNCTFPVFSSLGFCSNCADVTGYMQQQSNCTSKDVVSGTRKVFSCDYNLPPPGFDLIYSPKLTSNKSSFEISWGEFLPAQSFELAPAFLTVFLDSFNLTDRPNHISYYDYQVPFHSDRAGIIPSHFAKPAFIKFAPSKGSMGAGFIEAAHVCALSFCAREYNVSVELGSPHVDVLSTSYSAVYEQGDAANTYSYTFPNVTNNFTFTPNLIHSNVDSNMFEFRFKSFLSSILSGNVTLTTTKATPGDVPDIQYASNPSSVFQGTFGASTDIPGTMDRIALAMTTHLRDLSNLTVYGQAGLMETYIRVDWPWFTVPALSVSLGVALLIAAMIETRRQKLYIWKNSELAMLFHGLDLASDSSAEICKVSEMERTAAEMNVKLEKGYRGGFLLRKR